MTVSSLILRGGEPFYSKNKREAEMEAQGEKIDAGENL